MIELDFRFDSGREARTGVAEAVLCLNKSPAQIDAIVSWASGAGKLARLLLTRLSPDKFTALSPATREKLAFDAQAGIAVFGAPHPTTDLPPIAILTAGSADRPVAEEAGQTLAFYGVHPRYYHDVGVAGLHRFLEIEAALADCPAVIAIAGHEGALFSVVAGRVPGLVIAVPASTGYGVAAGGQVALHAALAGCAPGVVTMNIDNGFGAAVAALKILAPYRAQTGLRPPA